MPLTPSRTTSSGRSTVWTIVAVAARIQFFDRKPSLSKSGNTLPHVRPKIAIFQKDFWLKTNEFCSGRQNPIFDRKSMFLGLPGRGRFRARVVQIHEIRRRFRLRVVQIHEIFVRQFYVFATSRRFSGDSSTFLQHDVPENKAKQRFHEIFVRQFYVFATLMSGKHCKTTISRHFRSTVLRFCNTDVRKTL